MMRNAHVKNEEGDGETALQFLSDAVERWKDAAGGMVSSFSDEAHIALCRGTFLLTCKRIAESADEFRGAADLAESLGPLGTHVRAVSLSLLGYAESLLGDIDDALNHCGAAFLAMRDLYGPGSSHPDAAVALHNHAALLYRAGHFADAGREAELAHKAFVDSVGRSSLLTIEAARSASVITSVPSALDLPAFPEILPELVAPKRGRRRKPTRT